MAEYIKLVAASFMASYAFGIVFHIGRRNLLAAGIGGALTRAIYLVLLASTDHVFIQALVPAICSALYAEIMAMRRRTPSTVFLYPSILPLVPGGLLYYISVNLILQNRMEAIAYIWECALTLGGICLGFVVISTFTYYRRIYKVGEHLERYIRYLLHKPGKG